MMSASAIRVVIVDDSPDVVEAWRRLVSVQPDMEVVATLPSADALLPTCRDARADAVLLDLTMPGRDPLEALTELAGCLPATRVIVYSGWSDPLTVKKATQAGAAACVSKLDEPARVIEVIRSVAGRPGPAEKPRS
jgi:DNA-binding NarL/FixJ family response regulator